MESWRGEAGGGEEEEERSNNLQEIHSEICLNSLNFTLSAGYCHNLQEIHSEICLNSLNFTLFLKNIQLVIVTTFRKFILK